MSLKNIILFLCLLNILFLLACSTEKEKTHPFTSENGDFSTVFLNAKTLPTAFLDSLVILATGSDTIREVQYDTEIPFELQLFPHAPWRFYAGLYAGGGILMQEGSVEMELQAGESFFIEIPLRALVGFIYVEIPIGFKNPMQIASGTLKLNSKETNKTFLLNLKGPIAFFSSDALPLNTKYLATIALEDIYGDTIFTFQDSISIYDDNPVFNWQLTSLRSSVKLSIHAKVIEPQQFFAGFAQSKQRIPAANDIIFTEVFVAEKDHFEFLELFNGSLDSLVLDSCYVSAKNGTPSAIMIPANTVMRPASFFTIGGDSVLGANLNLAGFSLVNTKQALVLHCRNKKIDSLFYSSSDTLNIDTLGLQKNKSAQLPLRFSSESKNYSKWCSGTPSLGSDALCE